MKHIKTWLTLSALTMTLALTSSTSYANEKKDALVKVSTIEQSMLAEQVWIPGTVVSKNDSRLSTEVSGVIKWVAEEGTQVKQGDVLLKLDDEFLSLELKQAEANIKSLTTRVSLLERQQSRLAKLGNNAVLDELEEKRAEKQIAQLELSQAKLNHKTIHLRLEKTKLTAPFDGTVVERFKQVGEFSQINNPALRFVSSSDLEIQAFAPLDHSAFNKAGDKVLVKLKQRGKPSSNMTEVQSEIRALIPVGNNISRSMEVRIPLGKTHLPIGSAVRVSIASSLKHQALIVPRDALVLRQDATYVNVIDENLTTQQIAVETGSGHKDFIEVIAKSQGQLSAGQKVAIRGSENLKPGDKVRLMLDTSLTASR